MSNHDSPEVLVPSEILAPDEGVVYLAPRRRRYWLNVLLLVVTFFTTLVVGARLEWNFQQGLPPFSVDDGGFPFPLGWALKGHHLALGIPFALTLMLILLAHELGHYLYCVKYKVAATLPFFIPFPTLIGTLGAFIRIRSPLRSRAVLFDIGVAGPIAGFLVALPVLILSLGFSRPAPYGAAPPDIQLGYPLIFHLVRQVLIATGHAPALHEPLSRLYLHPISIAAWVGMFATSLNLLPGGQLDGGHIVFALSPRAHKTISRLTIFALIPLALFFWTGWLVWAILLRLSGMRHPSVTEWPDITPGRRWLAVAALLMLILTLAPAPIGPQSVLDSARSIVEAARQLHLGR